MATSLLFHFLSSGVDPDRRGLEHGDVRRHRVPGRSERQRDGLLHFLHRPHTLWQLYPALTLTHKQIQMCNMHVCKYTENKSTQTSVLLMKWWFAFHRLSSFVLSDSPGSSFLSLTSATTDTLLNVFLAIAVDNLANAQELTKVQNSIRAGKNTSCLFFWYISVFERFTSGSFSDEQGPFVSTSVLV